MKIKTRIGAWNGRSLTRFPLLGVRMADCLGDNGRLDPSKAARAFAGQPEYFQLSSRDDVPIYWVAMTFLEQMQDALDAVCDNPAADCNDHSVCRQDERVVAKVERGKFVFASVNLTRKSDGVVAEVHTDNPFGVVGASEAEARNFAVCSLQMLLRMARQVEWLEVRAERDLLNEATEANTAADRRHLRDGCARRVGGYCSPAKPGCPCYRDGRCEECGRARQ